MLAAEAGADSLIITAQLPEHSYNMYNMLVHGARCPAVHSALCRLSNSARRALHRGTCVLHIQFSGKLYGVAQTHPQGGLMCYVCLLTHWCPFGSCCIHYCLTAILVWGEQMIGHPLQQGACSLPDAAPDCSRVHCTCLQQSRESHDHKVT